MGWIILIIILVLIVCGIKIIPQSRAKVVERLGSYHATLQTGVHYVIPFIDRVASDVTLKEIVKDFAPQPVITKDNVTMQIDTVVYFQITDPKLYTYGVENPVNAIENLTATTLRNIIGELELDQTLTSRDIINSKMRSILDEATDPWGIKVNRVEVKNIIPPRDIQEAMEKQMKAYNLDVLEVSKSHFKTLKKIGYHNVYQLNSDDLHYVAFDLTKASGKNKNLRKAVYYGINKKVLKNDMDAQDVYVGHYLSTTLMDNQDVYDLNKAKSAQSDANKSKIDFEVSGDVSSLLRYDALKKTLKKANLELSQGSSFASIQETYSTDRYEIEDKINDSYIDESTYPVQACDYILNNI